MSNNYTIPKGKMYFDDGNGEQYIGNTPGADLGITTQSLDHYNGDSGINELDDTTLIEVKRTLSLIADHISVENWGRFIIGAASVRTQAATPVVDESVGAVKQGRYYQMGATSGNPSGVRDVGSVTVKVGATAKTLTTDYTLDATLGRVYIVPGGGIDDDDVVLVSYTPVAGTRDQVISASSAAIEGAMRFIADNPKGTNRDIFLPSVLLKPTGTAKIKATQAAYMELNFEIDIRKKDATTESIYIDGRPVATP